MEAASHLRMSDKISDEVFDTLPKKPNFLLIVIISGFAIVLILAAAYLLLTDDGKRLLHGTHPAPTRSSYAAPVVPESFVRSMRSV